MTMDWIDPGEGLRETTDAVGYVASVVDDAQALLVMVRGPDGCYHMRSFGDMRLADVALVTTMLQYQVGMQMYEDQE